MSPFRRFGPLLLGLVAAGCAQTAGPDGIPAGRASGVATLAGTTLPIATYRPAGCTPRLLLVVFHGVERNETEYRDFAVPLADRVCAVVIAPRFAPPRFPRERYQYGGLDAAVGERTVDLAASLPAWTGSVARTAGLPVVMLGHSAGAQFLDRVVAFHPGAADRFVIANPSTWMLPDTARPPPFGFAGLAQSTAMIRAYLSAPVSIVLGGTDTGRRNLSAGEEADDQGVNRLERGRRAFAAARATARREGDPLRWTFAEVPGVGHDAQRIFASPQVFDAVSSVIKPAP